MRLLYEFLEELAVPLLDRGVTPKRFGDVAKLAFVQAASKRSRLSNGRVNRSRVAAQTGLTRAEVKRLLTSGDEAWTDLEEPSAVERVLSGWLTDPKFATDRWRLKLKGVGNSFASLAKTYAGDIPYKALLMEFQAMGFVSAGADWVKLRRSQLEERNNLAFINRIKPILVDGLTIAASGIRGNDGSIQSLSLSAASDLELNFFKNRCVKSSQTMLEGLKHSLKGISHHMRTRNLSRRVAVTVLIAERHNSRSK